MHQEVNPDAPKRVKARRRISYTPDRARSALVYIMRIARDIRHHHAQLTEMREKYGTDTLNAADPKTERSRRYVGVLDKLGSCVDELEKMGIYMWDFGRCVVRFPARHDGKRAWIIWKYHDPDLLTWAYEEDEYGERPIETFKECDG